MGGVIFIIFYALICIMIATLLVELSSRRGRDIKRSGHGRHVKHSRRIREVSPTIDYIFEAPPTEKGNAGQDGYMTPSGGGKLGSRNGGYIGDFGDSDDGEGDGGI